MLVDELVFIDLGSGDVALGEDLDALGGELGDDEVLHRAGVGVGLDEDEGGVHEGRGGGRRGGSTLGVGVLLGEDLLDGALDALDGTLEERTETHHVRCLFECGRLSRPCVRTEQSEEPRVRSGRIYLALNRRADSERLARIAPLDSALKNSHVSDLFGVN